MIKIFLNVKCIIHNLICNITRFFKFKNCYLLKFYKHTRNNCFWSAYNNGFIMSNVSCWWRNRQGARRTKIRLSCQRSYDPPAQVPSIYRICARLGSYYVSVPLKSLPRSGPFVWGIVAMMPSSCGNNLVIESSSLARVFIALPSFSSRDTCSSQRITRIYPAPSNFLAQLPD